jgi:hypothetical protein
MPTPQIFTQITDEGFEALVSKGIHALLFPVHRVGSNFQADTSVNLLHGYPIGNFTKGEESTDQEEIQDQIRGGDYKIFVPGATDPGDLTFNAYFPPAKGKPDVEGAVNSLVITPQFVVMLARRQSATTLHGFLVAGVNYSGGVDIQGNYGNVIGTSLKFKLSGKPIYGFDKVGTIPMSLYNAGAGTQGASGLLADFNPLKTILDSTEIPDTETA